MEKRMYINGEWIESESGDTFEIYSPVTGKLIAELPKGNTEDVRKAIYAAAAAKNKFREVSPFARAAICHKIADILNGDVALNVLF